MDKQELNPVEGRVAYFVLESVTNAQGEFIALIAREGEPGYYKTDWTWGKDLELAEKAAARKNELLGLSQEDAYKIVLSSMRKK